MADKTGGNPSGKRNPAPPFVLHSALKDKPDLVVYAADLTVTARALAKLLAEQRENLFVHDRRPVLVLPADQDGAPTMRPVTCDEVIIAAHKVCQPIKYKDGECLKVTLPDKVAELYLAMPDEWRLRPLRGITPTPILHNDGSIRWEQGYDADTGLFCACNLPALSLPDKPSREDAEHALATLRTAFRTHAFADRQTVVEKMSVDGEAIVVAVAKLDQPPGKDESAFLVALLTAIARASLPLAPGAVVRGPSHSGSGVGKGLLAHAMSIIAHGERAHAAALGEGKEEFDKGLTAELLRGRPLVFIDNLNQVTLRSRLLCAVLGERDSALRRLGAGMESVSPAFIVITGNALTLAEDLVRRLITIELDAKCEHPEQRRFAGDFLTDIESRRTVLLQAALTIWRYGRQAKLKSKGSTPLGGFEHWTAWVRDPLVALGCQDPVARITDLKTSDPDRLAVLETFQAWWEQHSDDAITANELHELVKALLVPNPNKRNRQAVASRVAKLDGTRLGGFHLSSNRDDKNRGRWTPIVYKLKASEAEGEQAAKATPAGAANVMVITEADIGEKDDDDPLYAQRVRPADADGMPFASVHAAPAPITAEEMDELRRRGFTPDELFNINPKRARAIIADPKRTKLSERYGPGADAPPETICRKCKQPGARYFSDPDPTAGMQADRITGLYPLHLHCVEEFFNSNLPLEDEARPPDPEREVAGRSEEDDADDWQFNREPADPAVRPAPTTSKASPDAFNVEERVSVWRNAFAPLTPQIQPCPGWWADDWPRAHACFKQFLAGPHAFTAARAGWSALDLFGVHKVAGVAARDCVGALSGNSTNGFVARIEADELQFTNGRKVQKRPLDSDVCVPIWSFRAPTTTTSAPAPQEPAR